MTIYFFFIVFVLQHFIKPSHLISLLLIRHYNFQKSFINLKNDIIFRFPFPAKIISICALFVNMAVICQSLPLHLQQKEGTITSSQHKDQPFRAGPCVFSFSFFHGTAFLPVLSAVFFCSSFFSFSGRTPAPSKKSRCPPQPVLL